MALYAAAVRVHHQQKIKLPVGGCISSHRFILQCSSPDIGPVRGISARDLQPVCWCCCNLCQAIILQNWVSGDSYTVAVTPTSTNCSINGSYCTRSSTTIRIWSTLSTNRGTHTPRCLMGVIPAIDKWLYCAVSLKCLSLSRFRHEFIND